MQIFHSIEDAQKFLKSGSALTIGNYDGVHLGHRTIIKNLIQYTKKATTRARAGLKPAPTLKSVLLTFWPHPVRVLIPEIAPLLINTLEQKLELLAATGLDAVVIQSFDKKFAKLSAEDFFNKKLVTGLHAKYITVGHDFTFGDKKAGTIETLEVLAYQRKIAVKIVDAQMDGEMLVSSTLVRKLISDGKMNLANRLLTRDFFIDGTVIHGHDRGKALGLHTANLKTENELLPKDGVYATRITVCGNTKPRQYKSVTNIGFNPTFNNTERSIETHIFDFDSDIYGKKVRLEFIERLRDEIKFVGPEALIMQIKKDIDQAKKILRDA